ncbi:MAG: hypothetical protein JWM64_2753 [Frankiales bacterium]|nr:hypothetical protein [Frankiales bacterium]
MALLLTWELVRPGPDLVERLTVDDAGAVERLVLQPGGNDQPELGWWQGTLADDVLPAVQRVAAAPWPSGDAQARPPAAGAWFVDGTSGRLGLWDAPEGDALRPALAALRAACSDSATTAVAVLALAGETGRGGDGPAPLLRLASRGREELELRLDADAGPAVAVVTEDAEVLGFVGGRVLLPAGAEGSALLSGRPSGERGLEVAGTLRRAAGEDDPVRVRAVVALR